MKAEITSLLGLKVYTDRGKYVGKVGDTVLDANEKKITGLAISDLNPDTFDIQSRGVIIPYRWVMSVGDVVVIKQTADRFRQKVVEEPEESLSDEGT
ncbi:MAG: PRC-barrel domain-containing protein [Methanosarcinales archaeon Met12]|nr:MAG: PRC-barrel domain-containing protein [Methanosarcinales archaeon Met12]